MKKDGIVIAGNILVDRIKMIDTYPTQNMLANILTESIAVGGCVPNTAIDLKIIDPTLHVRAVGVVGDDADGVYARNTLRAYGVNADGVTVTDRAPTSYTDVMTVKSTGARTFFHAKAANALLCAEDVKVDSLLCKLFHLGYLLLLDQLDGYDAEFGTAAARLLSSVQQRGIKTSVDVVSESSDRFAAVVVPSLPYCDYLIINETEAALIAGIDYKRADGTVDPLRIEMIANKLFELGVKEKIVIHCPSYGFCMSKGRQLVSVPSLRLPKDYIKGSVGAGDAFCAGCLYALYRNKDDEAMLRFASSAAACSLSEADAVSGMKPYAKIMELESMFPRDDI